MSSNSVSRLSDSSEHSPHLVTISIHSSIAKDSEEWVINRCSNSDQPRNSPGNIHLPAQADAVSAPILHFTLNRDKLRVARRRRAGNRAVPAFSFGPRRIDDDSFGARHNREVFSVGNQGEACRAEFLVRRR